MWGRGQRGNHAVCSALCWLSVTSSPTHNQIGPFWCWFSGDWFCVCSRSLWVSPLNSPMRLGVSQPSQVFSVRGFEALFPHTGTLSSMVCLAPQLFLLVYPHAIMGPPVQPAATLPTPVLQPSPLPWVLSAQLPVSTAPPIGLHECFFFNSLVVGLPHSSIFCQLWLFLLFLNLMLSFFCLCEEAQCIYLCLHLGWKSSLPEEIYIYIDFYIFVWCPTNLMNSLSISSIMFLWAP